MEQIICNDVMWKGPGMDKENPEQMTTTTMKRTGMCVCDDNSTDSQSGGGCQWCISLWRVLVYPTYESDVYLCVLRIYVCGESITICKTITSL